MRFESDLYFPPIATHTLIVRMAAFYAPTIIVAGENSGGVNEAPEARQMIAQCVSPGFWNVKPG